MPKFHCFMMAARRDYARACIAAKAIRRRHPDWNFLLVTLDTTVAPWRDLGKGIFDSTVAVHELPPVLNKALTPFYGSIGCQESLAQAFHHLFAQGVDAAMYVNHDHVWFAKIPIAALEASSACAILLCDRSPASLESAACLVLHKSSELQGSMADHRHAVDRSWSRDVPSAAAIHRDGIGVRPGNGKQGPLRFAVDGELFLGDERVETLRFDARGPQADSAVVDTTWIELEKWYLQELERYEC